MTFCHVKQRGLLSKYQIYYFQSKENDHNFSAVTHLFKCIMYYFTSHMTRAQNQKYREKPILKIITMTERHIYLRLNIYQTYFISRQDTPYWLQTCPILVILIFTIFNKPAHTQYMFCANSNNSKIKTDNTIKGVVHLKMKTVIIYQTCMTFSFFLP